MVGELMDEAVSRIEHGGYDTLIVAAPDMQGRLFGRRLPARRARAIFEEGLDICTAALAWDVEQTPGTDVSFAGFHTGWHDFVLIPDIRTLRPYPGTDRTAICIADIADHDGKLLSVAPRTVLRQQIEEARQLGLDLQMASELEFYLFEGSASDARKRSFQGMTPTTLTRSDYSVVGQAIQEPFMKAVRDRMDVAGIPIYAYQAEYGYGQWEMNIEHSDPLEMADRHVIYKAGVKELAPDFELAATFMAKPVDGDMGSSCHFHVSVQKDGVPLLPRNDSRISAQGSSFIAGLLTHLEETSFLFNPYVNSFKRHTADDFGGSVVAWGYDNRTTALRVVGRGDTFRIEHRHAGADVNPYLGAAAIIASGLDGMRRALDAPPPVEGNAYAQPDLRRGPRSLGEAVRLFENSGFARTVFHGDVVDHIASFGRDEWNGYLSAVTDWELKRGFEIV